MKQSKLRQLVLGVMTFAVSCVLSGFAAAQEEIAGQEGDPTDAPFVPHNSHLGPGSIDIVPAGPTGVGNCIPFGNNTSFGFTGFIYRNVPAFELRPGCEFAFDLGRQNNVDTRRNIYFAVANKNPAPAPFRHNVISQGITALGWTQVVSDSQIPLNPRGNAVKGDYELIYTSEGSFSFPGGGLIVGFGGSPPGAFADPVCDQVLVYTDGGDPSGFFYARFFFRPDQSLGVLDSGGGGTGVRLGGIIIESGVIEVSVDIKPGSCPNPVNPGSGGYLPISVLGTTDFDPIDLSTVLLSRADGVGGSVAPNEGPPGPHSVFDDTGTPFDGELCDCHDLEGNGFDDLSMKFKRQDVVDALLLDGEVPGTVLELVVSGLLLDGTPFVGSDCIVIVGGGP